MLWKAKPEQLRWTPLWEQAFETLNVASTTPPILENPDFLWPFIIQVNVSNSRLGAVLTQEWDEEKQPILYPSRKIQLMEQCYSTIKKEAFTLKWAMESLHFYLTNNLFTLVAGHTSLQ